MATGLTLEQEYNISLLEEEIDLLAYTLYKLTMGLNRLEQMLDESGDIDIQLIVIEDYNAVATDFCMIAEQIRLRLNKHRDTCIEYKLPIEIDYERLRKQISTIPKQY
jgi:hypothetical protein